MDPTTRLILVPAAQTGWQAEGRLAGGLDLPLDELGHRQALAMGQAIAELNPTVLRCGPDQASRQTATIIAHEVGLRVRVLKNLREMNLGHWQGLTQDDLRDRFAKAFRQWRLDPLSIEPPEGESVSEAADRLVAEVRALARRHASDLIAVVVGRFACAILRARLADPDFERFWEYVDSAPQWVSIELAPPPPRPVSTPATPPQG
jgi:broad specificity phosphatase PhoE